jgi:hypothetical protein
LSARWAVPVLHLQALAAVVNVHGTPSCDASCKSLVCWQACDLAGSVADSCGSQRCAVQLQEVQTVLQKCGIPVQLDATTHHPKPQDTNPIQRSPITSITRGHPRCGSSTAPSWQQLQGKVQTTKASSSSPN